MKKKHWFSIKLKDQAEKEKDPKLKERMFSIAKQIDSCGSRTIWDVANIGYLTKCKRAKIRGEDSSKIPVPNVEEYVAWVGEVGGEEGALRTIGLSRCKRIQCPVCCFSRSYLRRKLALEWVQKKDWSDYFVVALTFTVPHKLSDSETPEKFKKVLDNLLKSISSFSSWVGNSKRISGKVYKSLNPESLGFMSSLEFTFSRNGLHPHFHSLYFTKSERDIVALKKWFKRDRVRVWKSSGKNIRMPGMNEDLAFKVLVEPSKNGELERVLTYINKGLFETLSSITKEKSKGESKTIFNLSSEELKYFCTFFEATRGKRFFRSGGICKEIKSIKDRNLEESESDLEVKKHLECLIKISSKDGFASGFVSSFVKKNQGKLEKKACNMTSFDIKKMVLCEWRKYLEESFERCKEAISFN